MFRFSIYSFLAGFRFLLRRTKKYLRPEIEIGMKNLHRHTKKCVDFWHVFYYSSYDFNHSLGNIFYFIDSSLFKKKNINSDTMNRLCVFLSTVQVCIQNNGCQWTLIISAAQNSTQIKSKAKRLYEFVENHYDFYYFLFEWFNYGISNVLDRMSNRFSSISNRFSGRTNRLFMVQLITIFFPVNNTKQLRSLLWKQL